MTQSDRVKRASKMPPGQKPPEPVGKPLDTQTSTLMGSRFGHDFSKVRIHTDEQAADSAQALGARAYTLGEHIVFGKGEYAPHTQNGQKTLAHELTHVVQQRGSGQMGNVQLGSPFSTHETQAERVSAQVMAGVPVSSHQITSARGVIQRTWGGAAAGAIGGAILGAGIGAFLGPIGALVGGLIGAVAGLAIGDAASAERRGLTSDERREAHLVFGDSMDYDAIRVTGAPVMSVGGYARTLPGTIYFPPDDYREDFSGDLGDMKFLVHEMTHAWQYQHGASVITTLYHAIRGDYNYDGEAGLRNATAQGRHFADFNTEEQGAICADYYEKVKKGENVSAYLPFITEVQNTSAPSSSASNPSTSSPSAAPADDTSH